jgi:hypothetical protein
VKQRRTRLILAQSVITAVLLGVVAMTLLSPEDQNELFGVDVPEQRIEPPGSERQGGDRGDGDDGGGDQDAAAEDDASGTTDSVTGAGVAGTGGAGLTAPGASPLAPSDGWPGDDGGDDEGPPGAQYDDTLARLRAAVD